MIGTTDCGGYGNVCNGSFVTSLTWVNGGMARYDNYQTSSPRSNRVAWNVRQGGHYFRSDLYGTYFARNDVEDFRQRPALY